MKTSQSAMTCLRREVPTDHEARGHTHAAGKAVGREPRLSGSAGLQPGKPNESEHESRSHPLTELCRQRPSTRAAREGERVMLGDHQTTAQHVKERGSARERANSSLRPKARSHAVAVELEKAMSRCKRRNGRTAAVRSSCETRTSTWTSTWTSTKWPRKRWTLRRQERADPQQVKEERTLQLVRKSNHSGTERTYSW